MSYISKVKVSLFGKKCLNIWAESEHKMHEDLDQILSAKVKDDRLYQLPPKKS